jgi:hypothetical protein
LFVLDVLFEDFVEALRQDSAIVSGITAANIVVQKLLTGDQQMIGVNEMYALCPDLLTASTSLHCAHLSTRKEFRDLYSGQVQENMISLVTETQRFARESDQ